MFFSFTDLILNYAKIPMLANNYKEII